MNAQAEPQVTVYDVAEAAGILRCTASWLKEQARKRRVPFSLIGGAYHFTPAHLAEIIRLFEQRPAPGAGTPVAARRTASPSDDVPELRARAPRRNRGAA